MKFLHVNNVSFALGGTLQCTHSCVKAFPDAEHVVFSFGSEFGDVAEKMFGPTVTLLAGKEVSPVVEDHKPDIILFNNTIPTRIPEKMSGSALKVYIQHSAHQGAAHAAAKCHLWITVSRWLADRAGAPRSTVLHQPVTVPDHMPYTRDGELVIGRIATPHPKKWNLDEIAPYYDAITQKVTGQVRYEWVAPANIHADLMSRFHGSVHDKCHVPSPEARSLLWTWHAVLYTSDVEESFGRIVREAQRCGCIPIVSRKGGFVEQIEPDAGFLVDTPNDAVEAVEEILDCVQCENLAGICRQRGDEEGSLQVWRERFLQRLSTL